MAVYDQELEGVQESIQNALQNKVLKRVFNHFKANLSTARKVRFVSQKADSRLLTKYLRSWIQVYDSNLVLKE